MADGEILATMINGAIRTSEQEEMARLLRNKSAVMMRAVRVHIQENSTRLQISCTGRNFEYVYEKSPSTVNEEKSASLR